MEEKKKKIAKMTDEVLKYFLYKNAKDIDLKIVEDNEGYTITAKSKIKVSDEEMEEIISNFRKHKDLEYEFFWELVGDYSDEDELELLFLLADDILIYYEENIFTFIIKNKV